MACWKVEAAAQRRVCEGKSRQVVRCFAGLHLLAVPVVVNGKPIAMWVCGQTLLKEPTRREFEQVADRLAGMGLEIETRLARRAYARSPVVTEQAWEALRHLLAQFADHLAEMAGHALGARQTPRPLCVRQAEEFVKKHLPERIRLRQVATAAHLSPYHFSRVFSKTTGSTLTGYISRLRVERAKTLLMDPFKRVTEVAFAAGFGSIPQFNAVFRKYEGMSPRQFRASLKQRFHI
jgi:AraC-like DNA-binding protein